MPFFKSHEASSAYIGLVFYTFSPEARGKVKAQKIGPETTNSKNFDVLLVGSFVRLWFIFFNQM